MHAMQYSSADKNGKLFIFANFSFWHFDRSALAVIAVVVVLQD